MDEVVKALLERTEALGFGNKRRGTITILDKEELS